MERKQHTTVPRTMLMAAIRTARALAATKLDRKPRLPAKLMSSSEG